MRIVAVNVLAVVTVALTAGLIGALVLLAVLPTIAHAEAPCPNEQLRIETHSTSLPDCRSYELVTPAQKNGQPIGNQIAGLSGSSFAFSTLGAFGEPGSSFSHSGPEYIATRGATGWSSLSVSAPATEFWGGRSMSGGCCEAVMEVSNDLSRALNVLAPLSGSPFAEAFYLQRPGASLVEVGPVSSPALLASFNQVAAESEGSPFPELLGATADLSHVFFAQDLESAFGHRPWYWPGDATVTHRSMYEYSGTGNSEPTMVAVAPGPREAVDRPAEEPTLISQCGAGLGGTLNFEQAQETGLDRFNAVSSKPSGEQGRTVFFTAYPGGCEFAGRTGTGPPVYELYARIAGSHTVAISEPTTGAAGDCDACNTGEPHVALFQGASADGTRVFFVSEQALFSGARGEAGVNLYEYNFAAADPHERVSLIAPNLAPGDSPAGVLSGVVRVSQDGARVYFVSTSATLATNPDAREELPKEGQDNLYVRETESGRSTFVGTLSPGDAQDWDGYDERPAETTLDGRFLLFQSTADLTPDASGHLRQIYRYDAQAGKLLRISVGDDGYNHNGNDGVGAGLASISWIHKMAAPHDAYDMSEDGSRVFFGTPAALTPTALDRACAFAENGACLSYAVNVYEWEAGHVYLISDGRDTHSILRASAVRLLGMSASGNDVFFETADQLVGQDGDTQGDVYDARVDGGFPAAVNTAACTSECQGPGSTPPVFGAPSSATLSGAGNLAAPAPTSPLKRTVKKVTKCKRGFVKKKARCVKRPKGKEKAKARKSARTIQRTAQ